MKEQRKLGAALSYVAQFIQIIVNLIYTPIMLRLVGQSEYGLYQMVYSVVSYLSLMSFGFNTSYIRYYSRYKADRDEQGIATLNGMFLTVFMVFAGAVAVVGGAFTANIEWVLGEKLTASEMVTARILMILMVVNLAATFPSSVFDCYVTSQERFIFQKLLIICQQALSPLIALPLLMLGYGSVAIIAVTTALTFAKLAVNIYYCLAKLKMKFCFRGFRFSLLRDMGVFSFFIFLNQIIDQINWSVDKFLLGRFLGTAAVAVYGVASSINTMYLHFSTAIASVFVPKVNALVAAKNNDRTLTELFTRVGRVQFLLLALVLIGFSAIGKAFVCLWGGPEYAQSYYVTLLLIIPVTIPLIQNLGLEIQRAKNMHQTRSIVYFCIAIGNTLLSIVLIQIYGVVGAAAGTAVALVLGNVLFMNWYYHHRIGLDMKYFWTQILAILPSLLLPCGAGVLVYVFADIHGWLELAVYGVLITAVYCASVYLWGLNAYEKGLLRSVFRRLTRKGSKKHDPN